jgi:hypothetical protein
MDEHASGSLDETSFLSFTSFHATHKSTRFDSGLLGQFFVFSVAELQKMPLVCDATRVESTTDADNKVLSS